MKRLIQLNNNIGSSFDDQPRIPTVFRLNNGRYIPTIGLGTVGIEFVETLENAIMDTGYVYLDTASMYKNEEIVG